MQQYILLSVGVLVVGYCIWWGLRNFSPPAIALGAVPSALQSVFSVQMIVVMAAFAALEFALWNSGWLPRMFEWPGILQIPIYGVLIFITNLVEEKTTGKLKTGARFMMIVAFTIFGLWHFNGDKLAAWWNTPSAPVQTVQRGPRSTLICDGNWHPVTLTAVPQLTTGRDGDKVTVNVDQGGVVLISKDGRDAPFIITPGADSAYTFAAATWRSHRPVAYANAMCPRR